MPTPKQSNIRAPVPKPLPSLWTSEPRLLDNHQSSATLPSTADVVIIGSGLAGTGTAYHLLHENSPDPPSIVLLEARQICSGATGRNGGHVKPDTYFSAPKYIKLYGAEAAAEMARFETAHVYAVKELVEREGLECDFHLTRAIDVYLDPDHARETESAFRRMVEAGVADLRDVAFTGARDAERISGVKGAQCCFSFTAAHLWPLKLVHSLLHKLLQKGLSLHANTPVTTVSTTQDNEGLWTVHTPRGSIRTRKVVYATNGYTASILPQYTNSIVPVRGICSHISSPKGRDAPHLVNTYGIRFDARNNDYLIPRADGSIVVGGARQRFWHNRERWFDNVRDDEMVEEARSYFDGYMQRLFRGWEGSRAEVKQVWTGIMGYSSDFVPHIGEVPDRPGQFILAGFSGHGMPEILLSSKAVAAMVRDGLSFEETVLPPMFKTTAQRVINKASPLEESLQSLWQKNIRANL